MLFIIFSIKIEFIFAFDPLARQRVGPVESTGLAKSSRPAESARPAESCRPAESVGWLSLSSLKGKKMLIFSVDILSIFSPPEATQHDLEGIELPGAM